MLPLAHASPQSYHCLNNRKKNLKKKKISHKKVFELWVENNKVRIVSNRLKIKSFMWKKVGEIDARFGLPLSYGDVQKVERIKQEMSKKKYVEIRKFLNTKKIVDIYIFNPQNK